MYEDSSAQTMQGSLQSDNIDLRLQRVEDAIQKLANSVDQIVNVVAPNIQEIQKQGLDQMVVRRRIDSDPERFVGPSHAFSFLKETPATIEAIAKSQNSAHHRAHSELQYLSNTLTRAEINQRTWGQASGFYVPTERVGYSLIGRTLFFPFPIEASHRLTSCHFRLFRIYKDGRGVFQDSVP